MSQSTPWSEARLLHVAEGHAERFMVDCDRWRCVMAYAWYWHQERLEQVDKCQHTGRKRAMIRRIELDEELASRGE